MTKPPREDPALLFLFAQLRSWSLQTVKGAIAVPGKTEFNVRCSQFSLWRLRLLPPGTD